MSEQLEGSRRQESRYVVGIDLGTTNSAVCYFDTETEPGTHQVGNTFCVTTHRAGDWSSRARLCHHFTISQQPENLRIQI